MQERSSLAERIGSYDSMLVAFSGGVDSALVAVTARRVLGRDRSTALLAVSPSLAGNQRRAAERIARAFDLAFETVATGEVHRPDYRANTPDRCFFCKSELWSVLSREAEERGLRTLADGTNADDVAGHRPGMRAGREHGVVSPLREAGYTKGMVRAEARRIGLPNWDAPAAPCLASRIRYGVPVSEAALRRVETGEAFLRSLGVRGNLRLRHDDDTARIEVDPPAMALVRRHGPTIAAALRALGYRQVSLDTRGYRTGALLADDAVLEPLDA